MGYTSVITTDAKDLSGNSMGSNYESKFKTKYTQGIITAGEHDYYHTSSAPAMSGVNNATATTHATVPVEDDGEDDGLIIVPTEEPTPTAAPKGIDFNIWLIGAIGTSFFIIALASSYFLFWRKK